MSVQFVGFVFLIGLFEPLAFRLPVAWYAWRKFAFFAWFDVLSPSFHGRDQRANGSGLCCGLTAA